MRSLSVVICMSAILLSTVQCKLSDEEYDQIFLDVGNNKSPSSPSPSLAPLKSNEDKSSNNVKSAEPSGTSKISALLSNLRKRLEGEFSKASSCNVALAENKLKTQEKVYLEVNTKLSVASSKKAEVSKLVKSLVSTVAGRKGEVKTLKETTTTRSTALTKESKQCTDDKSLLVAIRKMVVDLENIKDDAQHKQALEDIESATSQLSDSNSISAISLSIETARTHEETTSILGLIDSLLKESDFCIARVKKSIEELENALKKVEAKLSEEEKTLAKSSNEEKDLDVEIGRLQILVTKEKGLFDGAKDDLKSAEKVCDVQKKSSLVILRELEQVCLIQNKLLKKTEDCVAMARSLAPSFVSKTASTTKTADSKTADSKTESTNNVATPKIEN